MIDKTKRRFLHTRSLVTTGAMVGCTLSGTAANAPSTPFWVAEQISKLLEAFEPFPGKIIHSGTPENVGPVVKGDVIACPAEVIIARTLCCNTCLNELLISTSAEWRGASGLYCLRFQNPPCRRL